MRRRLAALTTGQALLLALAVATGVGALAVTVPPLANVGLLLASAALVGSTAVLAQWLWQSRGSTDWSNTFEEPAAVRGADARITRLAAIVRDAAAGDPVAAASLHDTIRGLAVERLHHRRGLTLDADPEAARAALGPDLTAYLTQPRSSTLPAAQLARFITTVEEL